jgi:antitoxin component YwqK of YwqJK toxin-antitoxin module
MAKFELLCFVALNDPESLKCKSVDGKISCRNEKISFASCNENGHDTSIVVDRTNTGIAKEFYPSGNIKKIYQITNRKIEGTYQIFSESGDLIHQYHYEDGKQKIKFF